MVFKELELLAMLFWNFLLFYALSATRYNLYVNIWDNLVFGGLRINITVRK